MKYRILGIKIKVQFTIDKITNGYYIEGLIRIKI